MGKTPPTTGQDAFDKHKAKNPSDSQPMYGRGEKGTGPSDRKTPHGTYRPADK
jgi:hypothetical protein